MCATFSVHCPVLRACNQLPPTLSLPTSHVFGQVVAAEHGHEFLPVSPECLPARRSIVCTAKEPAQLSGRLETLAAVQPSRGRPQPRPRGAPNRWNWYSVADGWKLPATGSAPPSAPTTASPVAGPFGRTALHSAVMPTILAAAAQPTKQSNQWLSAPLGLDSVAHTFRGVARRFCCRSDRRIRFRLPWSWLTPSGTQPNNDAPTAQLTRQSSQWLSSQPGLSFHSWTLRPRPSVRVRDSAVRWSASSR